MPNDCTCLYLYAFDGWYTYTCVWCTCILVYSLRFLVRLLSISFEATQYTLQSFCDLYYASEGDEGVCTWDMCMLLIYWIGDIRKMKLFKECTGEEILMQLPRLLASDWSRMYWMCVYINVMQGQWPGNPTDQVSCELLGILLQTLLKL